MNQIFKKILLIIATFSMLFSSTLSNISTVYAAGETVAFNVSKADDVINEAKKHIGKPYVWGAVGPDSFDCSGFISYIFNQVGLSLGASRITTYSAISFLESKGATSYTYSSNEGNPTNAKKGDLVFYYDNTNDPLHMGIYIGDGQVIHCAAEMPSEPTYQVMISAIDALGSKHGSEIVSYRVFRVFPQSGGFQIKKINENGEPLAGVTFEITKPDGSKSNVTTNSNGIWDSDEAQVDLEVGTYKVKEVSTVHGYLLDSTIKTIEIKAGQKSSENIISFTNKVPTGEIIFTKYNTDKTQTIPNTTYHVTNNTGYEKDVTTNSNGQIHLTNLKLGTYTFTEIQAAQGYLLNENPVNVTLNYKDQNTPVVKVQAEQTDDVPTGEIILTKYNSDKSAGIPNTTYHITSDIGFEKDVVTDTNGQIHLTDLKLGTYTLVETKAAEGYLLDATPITINLKYQDQYTAVISSKAEQINNEPTASITLTKEDKETGHIAQGDATLKGAEYQLIAAEDIYNRAKTIKFYSKGELVASRTTNENGEMETINDLPLGHYQFKEVSASEGYLLDETVYDIHCDYEGQNANVVLRNSSSYEQVKKQAFQIVKVSTEGSQESDLVSGAEFTVKLTSEINTKGWDNAKTYDVLTTDQKGYAKSIELPYGTYTVRETKTPDELITVPDFEVTVSDDSREPQEWRIFNNTKFKALIKAVKVDENSGKTVLLANTTFKIKNLTTNEYVGQWVWFPVPHYVTEFKTDETGTVTTPTTLEVGEYQLEEIHAPYGYVLDTTPIKFKVSSNTSYQLADDNKTPLITVTKENDSTVGLIKVNKIGEQLSNAKEDENGNIQFIYEKYPVVNANFIIEADEDIYSPDNQKDLIYPKGTIVSEITTSSDEDFNVSDYLPLGKYKIYENIAGEGFVLNKEVKYVELTYENELAPVVFEEVDYENKRQKVDLTITKKDKETNTLLEGAVFGLYADEDIYGVSPNVPRIYLGKVLLVEKGTLIETVTTDENGQAKFNSDLPINGKFVIKEIKAPIGYSTNDEVINIDTSYQGQDIDTITFNPEFKNEITKFDISKKDITNDEEIADAFLTVYPKDEPGAIYDSWISGTDGMNEDGTLKPHRIIGLEVGKTYILQEISAPHGYALTNEIEFTVQDTGEIQSVEMKDEMVFGQLEWNKTGEIFNQVITGQNEFGLTQSPIWNMSNLLGAEITIYSAEDIIIGNHTYYKTDETIQTLESDLDTVISEKLPVGKYYYKETKVPHGYIIDTDKHYFEIEDNQINELQKIDSTLNNNRAKVNFDLTKVLEEQNIFKNKDAYQDIIFGIFAREDIYDYMGNVAIEHDSMIYTSGINEDGHLTLADTFDLPNGVYYLKELAANSQYVLNDTEYDFEISYHGEDVSEYTVQIGNDGIINNELARGSIQIIKKDSDNENKILKDVEFNLSTKEDMSELLSTAKTNEQGIVTFDELELGTYYIQEAKQVDGYVINDHIYKVDITKDGDLLTITCMNKPTEMEFSKQDITTFEELPGAHITVTDKDTGKVVDEWTSTNETHIIKYLVEGKEYIMTEMIAPENYELAESITFTAKDGQKIIMKDKRKPVSVDTSDMNNSQLWLMTTALSMTALLILKRKKKIK